MTDTQERTAEILTASGLPFTPEVGQMAGQENPSALPEPSATMDRNAEKGIEHGNAANTSESTRTPLPPVDVINLFPTTVVCDSLDQMIRRTRRGGNGAKPYPHRRHHHWG